jgi:hypothetical protein
MSSRCRRRHPHRRHLGFLLPTPAIFHGPLLPPLGDFRSSLTHATLRNLVLDLLSHQGHTQRNGAERDDNRSKSTESGGLAGSA